MLIVIFNSGKEDEDGLIFLMAEVSIDSIDPLA